MKITKQLLIFAIINSIASSFAAAPKTGNFNSIATIASSCQILATDILIGNITASGASATVYGSGNLIITCSNGLSYKLNMSNGNNYANGTTNMKGSQNAQIISYCMRSTIASIENSCLTSYWGPDASHAVNGSGIGSSQTIPMYAITKTGYYVPDNYSDTMTVTISY